MSEQQPFLYDLINATPLEICATCKKVIGTDVSLLLPLYLYGESVSIRFNAAEYCQCAKEPPGENQSEDDDEDERAHWDFYEYSDGYPDSSENDDEEE